MLQHVSDHRGSIIREPCTVLGQNYKNVSIASVGMDVFGVMAAYYALHCIGRHCPRAVILAKYCTRLPDDGSSVIRNMLQHF